MGVEYCHYVFPENRLFRPEAGQVVSLMQRLTAERWIGWKNLSEFAPRMGSSLGEAVETGGLLRFPGLERVSTEMKRIRHPNLDFPLPANADEHWLNLQMADDVVLIWPVLNVETSGLRYPFANPTAEYTDFYYNIHLYVGHDLFGVASECIEESPAHFQCSCGESLEFHREDQGYTHAWMIRARCPRCKAPFDSTLYRATLRDGITGDEIDLPGGACFRFGLSVDCMKAIPVAPFSEASPEFHPELKGLLEDHFGMRFVEAWDFY